ncbi:unnamed protein product [Linum tenue]|uniref:Uncharacterized protein n=1 Tax=Linum tenue TaxID=586396 RepID=A0AAV0PX37_9ROSI|nr:unnamed protein product [Linum tenue]CAI0540570.1 unnamed protein product [Linum tenue]
MPPWIWNRMSPPSAAEEAPRRCMSPPPAAEEAPRRCMPSWISDRTQKASLAGFRKSRPGNAVKRGFDMKVLPKEPLVLEITMEDSVEMGGILFGFLMRYENGSSLLPPLN